VVLGNCALDACATAQEKLAGELQQQFDAGKTIAKAELLQQRLQQQQQFDNLGDRLLVLQTEGDGDGWKTIGRQRDDGWKKNWQTEGYGDGWKNNWQTEGYGYGWKITWQTEDDGDGWKNNLQTDGWKNNWQTEGDGDGGGDDGWEDNWQPEHGRDDGGTKNWQPKHGWGQPWSWNFQTQDDDAMTLRQVLQNDTCQPKHGRRGGWKDTWQPKRGRRDDGWKDNWQPKHGWDDGWKDNWQMDDGGGWKDNWQTEDGDGWNTNLQTDGGRLRPTQPAGSPPRHVQQKQQKVRLAPTPKYPAEPSGRPFMKRPPAAKAMPLRPPPAGKLQVLAPAMPKQPPAGVGARNAKTDGDGLEDMIGSVLEDEGLAGEILHELTDTWTRDGGNEPMDDNDDDDGNDDNNYYKTVDGAMKRKRGTKNRAGRKIQLSRMKNLLLSIQREAEQATQTD